MGKFLTPNFQVDYEFVTILSLLNLLALNISQFRLRGGKEDERNQENKKPKWKNRDRELKKRSVAMLVSSHLAKKWCNSHDSDNYERSNNKGLKEELCTYPDNVWCGLEIVKLTYKPAVFLV